jgi:hypothetical protein
MTAVADFEDKIDSLHLLPTNESGFRH